MAPLPVVVEFLRKGVLPSFRWPVMFCVYTTATSWIMSVITGNVSQVDRIWTVCDNVFHSRDALTNTPAVYARHLYRVLCAIAVLA